MSIGSVTRKALKGLSMTTGFLQDEFFRRYPYMFTPQQLHFLTDCLVETRNVTGCVVEAGCAFGATTVYLSRFMAAEEIERDYVVIDTFAGFVPDQVDHEIAVRGKRQEIRSIFAENSKAWFDRAMAVEGVPRLRSCAADVTRFDFASVGPIAFCLLDVDLYLPIRDALPKIHDRLASGGMIVIDDCAPGGDWDGALQAYQEYCAARGIAPEIHCDKLGVLRKPL